MSVMQNIHPTNILNDGAIDERGENVRLSIFMGALAITDLVKTTLGPKGMDKILQSLSHENEVNVTNDGATILRSIHVDNPAGKVLVDISKAQDDEVGDGTTSVCVLAGELLREARALVEEQKIHPQTIIQGWREGAEVAQKALAAIAQDNSADEAKYREDLYKVACTTLSSKVLCTAKDHFATLAVDAVLRLNGSTNLEHIQIIKKLGSSMWDSFLDDGFILEKKFGVGQPKRIVNAKIMVADTPMDNDKVKIFGARVKVDSTAKVADIETAERAKMIAKCEKIAAHGCNVFINRQLIYNLPETYFADNGITSIEHADFDGVERLALVFDADIVATFETPDKIKLGTCDLVEEIMIGEDRAIRFSGVAKGEACTVVLRGSSQHVLDEAERSLHDALCVLSQMATENRVVPGAGVTEMEMAEAVDVLAKKTAGKKAIAMQAMARAFRQLPAIIADNGGYDSADLIARLQAAHHKGDKMAGLNMDEGTIADISELGVYESLKVKSQVVASAVEAAEMILRVDEIIRAAPRQRDNDPRY
eukprot:TRINITY_DN10842_c1_g1_i1.p1 TRINITY_DN10842_c1_g1~~TRINITY_DN10842_c1_g1_i1.p1  ORF type:complete len:553 (-),score=176.98 TRINITY_DN10842_c1_g1_i1:92-1702(-)